MFFFRNKNKKNNNSKLKILSGYNYRYRNIGKESEKTICVVRFFTPLPLQKKRRKVNAFDTSRIAHCSPRGGRRTRGARRVVTECVSVWSARWHGVVPLRADVSSPRVRAERCRAVDRGHRASNLGRDPARIRRAREALRARPVARWVGPAVAGPGGLHSSGLDQRSLQ